MISEIKNAINNLIKILIIFRKTSPLHNLSNEEKEEIIIVLNETMEKLKKIKEEIEK